MRKINSSSTPTLSVIIPAYNCAPVIIRCIDSIDYDDSEIIVINDGSTDNTEYIIKKYQETHGNIKLINKPNGGVSSARNVGIENAKGKYIAFIDADDYISNDGLTKIVRIAKENNAEIVKYKSRYINPKIELNDISLKNTEMSCSVLSGANVLQRYDVSDYVVWDGIYLRSLIEEHKIRFMTDLYLHEDDVFMGMILCHANVVISTDLKLYNYVCSSNYSSTHNQCLEKRRRLIYSGLKAIRYRSQYVNLIYPNVMKLERLKYMRWVCNINMAIDANISYREYKLLLKNYKDLDVYPLDYSWIKVAGKANSFKSYIKQLINTFFINHSWVGYPLMRFIIRIKSFFKF